MLFEFIKPLTYRKLVYILSAYYFFEKIIKKTSKTTVYQHFLIFIFTNITILYLKKGIYTDKLMSD